MINVLEVIQDPDMGFTGFTISRTQYRRKKGNLISSNELIPADGTIHPGVSEKVELLPEEMQRNEFITIHTAYKLYAGENNAGGITFQAADIILHDGKSWRVIKVQDYSAGGYYLGVAMRLNADEAIPQPIPDPDPDPDPEPDPDPDPDPDPGTNQDPEPEVIVSG